MFSLPKLPSSTTTTTIISTYASFAASLMLVRSLANDLVPDPIRSYFQSAILYLFTPPSNQLTIVVDENSGILRNQMYEAAEIYLRKKVNPSTQRFKVGKTSRQKTLNVTIEKNEEVIDTFQKIKLKWKLVVIEASNASSEKHFFELIFHKKHKEKVLNHYLPFVLRKAKEMKESNRVVKLYTRDVSSYDEEDDGGGVWGSINLEHPSTFETLAMEPALKKAIIDDMERFVRRKEYYKKVGKAWKRGYLLYGPPGTGKSSLIAAMANYLKFDIYDLELSSFYSDSDMKRVLVSTTNRSMIVIEDIDCSKEMQDRELGNDTSNSKLTLSGMLNFIDGLWSSCGDERIIIFTTNHKDRLDPALLRPGRMDMHIHMSYCTFEGFKILASNYLDLYHHRLFGEIESLIENVEVTPAEVAEELMRSEDNDVALAGVIDFLKQKQIKAKEMKEKNNENKIQDGEMEEGKK